MSVKPWRRTQQPTKYSCLQNALDRGACALQSWGLKESDLTSDLAHSTQKLFKVGWMCTPSIHNQVCPGKKVVFGEGGRGGLWLSVAPIPPQGWCVGMFSIIKQLIQFGHYRMEVVSRSHRLRAQSYKTIHPTTSRPFPRLSSAGFLYIIVRYK